MYQGFQKTPHLRTPGDNMLTLLMVWEQGSTDLSLSPDSYQFNLDKLRQFISLGLGLYTEGVSST